eukprot:1323591-Amorphochlora_amoeboformis.AAC.2
MNSTNPNMHIFLDCYSSRLILLSQKQISRDKNSRSSKGEAKKSKGEDGKANCGNPTPSV